ncbi:hypothetical protein Bbelb_036120 [Branchiostoma belcheri]|nr:hypothetical protein Bbelb_036120 [Branchiostoma belcheri]
MEWAMKFLPIRYREQMTDVFSTRGKSWHVTAVITKEHDGEHAVDCFVQVVDNRRQDWSSVSSVLENFFHNIMGEKPAHTKVFLRSDNAGCYHCAPLLLPLPMIGLRTGINVLRYNFSDPQTGKDICDRKIVFKRLHGLKKDTDTESADDWVRDVLPTILQQNGPEDIYNTDEAGLYYRVLPKGTLSHKSEARTLRRSRAGAQRRTRQHEATRHRTKRLQTDIKSEHEDDFDAEAFFQSDSEDSG